MSTTMSPIQRSSSSPMLSSSLDDFLNLDMTAASSSATNTDTTDFLSDLFPSPNMSDVHSPSSATASALPGEFTTPPLIPDQSQTALDSIDISNHAVFSDLYKTYIEPLANQGNNKPLYGVDPLTMEPGAFSFNDLFASYAAAATMPIPNATPAALVGNMHPMFAQTMTGASGSGGGAGGGFPSSSFTIDPQLVASPATTATSTFVLPTPLSASTSIPASIIDSPVEAPTASTSTSNGKSKSKPAAQVVNKSTPRAQSSTVSDDEDDEDEDDEDDDDLMMLPVSTSKGGKNATKKKVDNSVAKGGIVKRTGATSCVVRDPDSNDPDDWRPSPEEYKKLSSKEKRQLRNKISARNFRVRRKEYITTLEGQISDRDKLIAAIREELGAQQLANNELRQEIDALKKAMLEGRHGLPAGLPPPQTTVTTRKSASALPKANPHKDIAPGSPRGFWGGVTTRGMGGVTPVHSAFSIVPDMASVLGGKGGQPPDANMYVSHPPTTGPGAKWLAALQDNINPNMNPPRSHCELTLMSEGESSGSSPTPSHSSSSEESSSSPNTPPLRLIDQLPQTAGHAWTGYSDINPFTIKTLDSYRLQLWAKMAADSAAQQQQQQQQQQQSQQNLFNAYQSSGLSGNLRPQWFQPSKDNDIKEKEKENKENVTAAKASQTLSAVLAGKTVSALSSSSSSSASPSPITPAAVPSAVTNLAASAVSQSIVSRMTGAFWDAFSLPSTAVSRTNNTSINKYDMDKVRKVIEGKAVLKVVDVPGSNSGMGALEEKMGAMKIEEKTHSPIRKDSWNHVNVGLKTEKKPILG